MINITDSRSIRASSNVQKLLNDLANIIQTKWPEMNITTSESNVSSIYVSDDVYMMPDSGNQYNIKLGHNTLGYYQSLTVNNGSYAYYIIVETDSAVLVHLPATGAWSMSMAIGETKNLTDNTTSYGIAMTSAPYQIYTFTDGMYSTALTSLNAAFFETPQYNEQYVPFTPWNSKDLFPDVYMVTARKSTTKGQTLLNGTDYYYVGGALAVKYTL